MVFKDSTIALMSLLHESKDGMEQPNTGQQKIKPLQIKQEFRILNAYQDKNKLRFVVSNHGAETWVCAWDISTRSTITLCSIKQEQCRRLRIKPGIGIRPTFVHCSILQKVILLVRTKNYKPFDTRIWNELVFDNETRRELPIRLSNGQGFGFTDCGSYFLSWNCNEREKSAIRVYDVRLLKRTSNPIAKRSLGSDVLLVKGKLVKQDQFLSKVLGYTPQKKSLIVGCLVVSSNKVELIFWDIYCNKSFKKMVLTMKEVISIFRFHY